MSDEELLAGGLMNPGAVVRVGDTVRRPARPGTQAVCALLEHLERVGFAESPRFLGLDEAGREVLSYIPGEVAVPPFPSWAVSEESLGECARLIARYHEAAEGFDGTSVRPWSQDLADPAESELLCHNDVCPENVVFREGKAVGLIDFDFAAPGRRIWDVAMAARMWAPFTHPRFRTAWPAGLDAARRLGVFACSYGITTEPREFVDTVLETRAVGIRFVRRQVQLGNMAFEDLFEARGGDQRMKSDDQWVEANYETFVNAVESAL